MGEIRTKPSTKEYRDGYDRIFKQESPRQGPPRGVVAPDLKDHQPLIGIRREQRGVHCDRRAGVVGQGAPRCIAEHFVGHARYPSLSRTISALIALIMI